MTPLLSVIIAAYNEEKLLPRCLEALQKQNYPKEKFEIIVVDNNSKDQTAAIARKYGARVFSYTEIQGCGATRQYGTEQAKGSIIVFTDPDCLPAPDWLTKIDAAFTDKSIFCIGGRAVPVKKTLWMTIIFGFYNWFHIFNHAIGKPILWGYNFAIRKEQYDAVGGINKNLLSSDDWDVIMRMKKRFGGTGFRYLQDLPMTTIPRKQENIQVFTRYAFDGLRNYIDMILLGKTKARPVFNVR
jgi:glycosyltransferase involved in cell wall biosynthesis